MKLSENSLLDLIKQVIREEEEDKEKKPSGDKPPEDKETDFQDLPIPFPEDPFKKDVDESKIKLQSLVKESFWNQAAQMKGWEAPPKERRWSKSMNDGLGHLTEFEKNRGGKDYVNETLPAYPREWKNLEKACDILYKAVYDLEKAVAKQDRKSAKEIGGLWKYTKNSIKKFKELVSKEILGKLQ